MFQLICFFWCEICVEPLGDALGPLGDPLEPLGVPWDPLGTPWPRGPGPWPGVPGPLAQGPGSFYCLGSRAEVIRNVMKYAKQTNARIMI